MAKKKPYRPRNRDHVHTPGDGRGMGIREVYLNGGLIQKAFYADTRKGVVRYFVRPMRRNQRRGDALFRTKRGKVTVRWLTA